VLEGGECRRRYNDAQLDEIGARYGKRHRAVRRWLKLGRDKSDPCPIERPAEMPAWWARNMAHRVPYELLEAAKVAGPIGPTPEQPRVMDDPAPAEAAPREVRPMVDLTAMDLPEGENVRQLRRLVNAAWVAVERAYATPGADVDLPLRRHEKASEALRKSEGAQREWQRKLGNVVAVADVQRDLDNACNMFREMRETMARRVLELCPSLGREQRAEVAAAIEKVRGNEDRLFQRLASVRPGELAAALAA